MKENYLQHVFFLDQVAKGDSSNHMKQVNALFLC